MYLFRRRAVMRLSKNVLTGIDPQMSGRILDAGARVGGLLEMVHRKFGSQADGLTISSVEVMIGNQNFARAGLLDSLRMIRAGCSKPLPVSSESTMMRIDPSARIAGRGGRTHIGQSSGNPGRFSSTLRCLALIPKYERCT